MAKKEKKTTTTTTKTSSGSRSVINMLAFVGVICVGLALALGYILSKVGVSAAFVTALSTVAQCIAYLIISYLSFFFVRRRHWGWILTWAIAVALIVVFIVLHAL